MGWPPDVFLKFEFQDDRYVGAVGDRNLPFPIDKARRLYNSLLLPHKPWYLGDLSHAYTVVWEWCMDDRQSQWAMAKFDPQPTLNPLTDRHQIWNTWLRRRYILPTTFGLNPPRGFCPHIPECLLHFLKFIRAPTDALVEPIFTFNTSYDVVLRKGVPYGVRKFKFKIWLSY